MREQDRHVIQLHKVMDTIHTALAFWLAFLIKNHALPFELRGLAETVNYYVILLLAIIIWYVGFQYFDFHSAYGRQSERKLVFRIAAALMVHAAVLVLAFYVLKLKDISRALLGIFLLLDFLFLYVSMKVRVYRLRNTDCPKTLLVIIGSRESARELLESLYQDPALQCSVMGCLDTDPDEVGKPVHEGVRVVGTLDQLQEILTNEVIDEIIFAMPLGSIWSAEQYLTIAETVGVKIRLLPHWHLRKFLMARPRFYSMHFEEFYGNPTLVLTATPQTRYELLIKSAIDYAAAFLSIVVFLPFGLIISCLIKIASPGPVFYRQERCGVFGRRFSMIKFRTMIPDADRMLDSLSDLNEADGPVFKMKNDPRVIPYIGTFLRKTSLDELPQLLNVLRGEMSLVGPRPPIPEEVARYELWERRRLSMKPGITCLWQIAPGRNKLSFAEWMKLDLEYIDSWSLWLDIKIVFMTFRAMLLRYGL